MSEQTRPRSRLVVNEIPLPNRGAGAPAAVRLPASRPRADRHPRRLRARRLRRLHGAGRRGADALLSAAGGQPGGRADHDRGGTGRGGAVAGAAGVRRVPRPAVRILHARLPDHDHRGAAGEPAPDAGQAREMVGGNLCRCTGYQNIVKSVLAGGRADRARCDGRRRNRHDDRMVGEPVQAGGRRSGWWPAAAATSTTSGATRSRSRCCARRTPTPRSSTSTSPARSRSRDCWRSTPTRI